MVSTDHFLDGLLARMGRASSSAGVGRRFSAEFGFDGDVRNAELRPTNWDSLQPAAIQGR